MDFQEDMFFSRAVVRTTSKRNIKIYQPLKGTLWSNKNVSVWASLQPCIFLVDQVRLNLGGMWYNFYIHYNNSASFSEWQLKTSWCISYFVVEGIKEKKWLNCLFGFNIKVIASFHYSQCTLKVSLLVALKQVQTLLLSFYVTLIHKNPKELNPKIGGLLRYRLQRVVKSL